MLSFVSQPLKVDVAATHPLAGPDDQNDYHDVDILLQDALRPTYVDKLRVARDAV